MQGEIAYIGIEDIRPLEPLIGTIADREACATRGRDGKPGCRSKSGAADVPAHIWDKIRNHPCYSEDAHHHYARMHVAVAPACNIQCNYCNRKYDCANESRPGVVSERLTPEQAAKKVLAVAGAIPQMTVLGVAGPGDPLANPDKTFRTFELIRQTAPDIKLCLSTNGLALPGLVDRITQYNVDHVTITINMVDPEIGQHIYPWIFWNRRRWSGIDAAKILHEHQMEGLELLAARGILTKINSVMIPGINDTHLVEVNRETKQRGAFLHNIMPLISAPEHGTVFGMNGRRGPTAGELKALQDRCEKGAVTMMRHCRQCRADAVGMLGEDRSSEFTTDKVEHMEVEYDLGARLAYRERVEQQRAANIAARDAALAELDGGTRDIEILVAVATKGEGRINEHFGHASEFQIYQLSRAGSKFVGHRRVDLYCQGGYGDEDALPSVVRAINDCHAVFVAKIGGCPRDALRGAGIDPVDEYAHEFIEESTIAYFNEYLARVKSGQIEHQARADAAIRQGAYVAAA